MQWAKPHDATKMSQLLCVKLEDPKKITSQALRRSRAVIHLVWAATGQSRPGCGGRRGVGRAAGGWAEAHGGGPGKRMVALLSRAFRTAGIVLE